MRPSRSLVINAVGVVVVVVVVVVAALVVVVAALVVVGRLGLAGHGAEPATRST
jgi:hypothetical protein